MTIEHAQLVCLLHQVVKPCLFQRLVEFDRMAAGCACRLPALRDQMGSFCKFVIEAGVAAPLSPARPSPFLVPLS